MLVALYPLSLLIELRQFFEELHVQRLLFSVEGGPVVLKLATVGLDLFAQAVDLGDLLGPGNGWNPGQFRSVSVSHPTRRGWVRLIPVSRRSRRRCRVAFQAPTEILKQRA